MAKVEMNTTAIMRDLRGRVDKGVKAVAEASKTYMRYLLQEPYPPASAPGESPHLRTGHLQDSCYMTRLSGGAANTVTYRVGNDAEYAVELEYGLFEGGGNFGGSSERPFIRPTFYDVVVGRGQEIFASEVAD